MGSIFLIDTDSVLALTHTQIGQRFLRGSTSLRLAAGVEDELLGPRKDDPATEDMARRAEDLLEQNSYAERVSVDRVDSTSGDFDYGEQSIHDYILLGEQDVVVVFFFDADMEGVIERVGRDIEFFPVSKVVTLNHFGLTQEEQRTEVLKIAKGRGWRSEQNLYDLLVKTDILTDAEFDYQALLPQLRSVQTDL